MTDRSIIAALAASIILAGHRCQGSQGGLDRQNTCGATGLSMPSIFTIVKPKARQSIAFSR